MDKKPYVIMKCAMSIDGYLDDASDTRLILSHPEDFDKVIDVNLKSVFYG